MESNRAAEIATPAVPPELLSALQAASEWIGGAAHGDNCFVSDHYPGDPGNRCNCGKDSIEEYIDGVIERATQSTTPVPAEPEVVGEGLTDEQIRAIVATVIRDRRMFVNLSRELTPIEIGQVREIAVAAGREVARAALAQASAPSVQVVEPIPMLLHCPQCGAQHVDAPEDADCDGEVVHSAGWGNPPHRSHLCHHCGCIWRPADVPTTGVKAIATKGKDDTWDQGFADSVDAQLRATGASALPAAPQPAAEPPKRVFLVPTGEVFNDRETYTRHEYAPPPLCDFETLYTAASPAEQPQQPTLTDEMRSLLSAVPLPPKAITYEHGWTLLDRLQALAIRAAGGVGATPSASGERD